MKPAKRGRGRPPRNEAELALVETAAILVRFHMMHTPTTTPARAPRTRGRPRKQTATLEEAIRHVVAQADGARTVLQDEAIAYVRRVAGEDRAHEAVHAARERARRSHMLDAAAVRRRYGELFGPRSDPAIRQAAMARFVDRHGLPDGGADEFVAEAARALH